MSANQDNLMTRDVKVSEKIVKETLLQSLISGYKTNTSTECKSIDSFLAFTVLTGVAQLIYCFLTKGQSYNTFIGVFSASVGSFVFAGNLFFKRNNHL